MNERRQLLEFLTHPETLAVEKDALKLKVLNDFSLWVDAHDISLTPCLRDTGFWESWITVWFMSNVRPDSVVLDVGANFGYYTMLSEFLMQGTGKVIAYEANPVIANLLKRTKKDNDADFEIRNYAVADKAGSLVLSYPGEYMGSASIMTGFEQSVYGEEHSITVPTITLDSEREAGVFDHVDLIKVDVESAEELVWNGARDILYGENAPTIVLEYSPTGVYSEGFIDELMNYGRITRINHIGTESPVTRGWIEQLTDWDMLVLRPKFS